MGQFDALNQTINSMNPRAIRERKQEDQRMSQAQDWKMEMQGMERQLFASQMKQISRQTAAADKRAKALGEMDTLSGIAKDVEDVLTMDLGPLSNEAAREKMMDYAEKYDNPQHKQLFAEAAINGNYEPLYRMLDQGDAKLEREYGIKSSRKANVTGLGIDGSVVSLPENSRLLKRKLSDKELDAHESGLKYNTKEWHESINPTRVPDQAEVVNPEKPTETMFVDKDRKHLYLPPSNKQKEQVNIKPLTAGQLAVDKAYAKEYVGWRASGGYANIQKSLTQLSTVKQRLLAQQRDNPVGQYVPFVGNDMDGGNLSGTSTGLVPEGALKYTNPYAADTRDMVHGVVQQSLKAILGAQFTEKEGERILARAYDISQDESVNFRKVSWLFDQIETMAMAKESAANYYNTNGTLQGWEGEMPNFNTLDLDQRIEDALGAMK